MSWVERTAALTPSDAGDDYEFGYSCALSSDGLVLAVGARKWSGGGFNARGAIYVFDWNGSSWVERTTALAPSDAGNIDWVGHSCALSADGSVLAIGVSAWDGPAGSAQGAVYVYDWNGVSWVERTTALTPSDAGANDFFGSACSLSGDGAVLVVGAEASDSSGNDGRGGVYVFDWNGSAWVQRGPVIRPSDAGDNDQFGTSSALSRDGQVLAVGAGFWDGPAGVNQGAVYVFDWDGSSWVERTTALTSSDAAHSEKFGAACGLSADGSVLSVGSRAWHGPAGNDQGAVYVFDWDGSTWVERTTALTPSDPGSDDDFGVSSALSANASVLAVGAPWWDGPAGREGAVYVFDGPAVSIPGGGSSTDTTKKVHATPLRTHGVIGRRVTLVPH